MNEFDLNTRALAASGDAFRRQEGNTRHALLWQQANQLFWQTYLQGFRYRLWSRLFRRPFKLYDLNRLCCPSCHQYYAGVQTISLTRVRGSEGRCGDFDTAFHPTSRRLRERWTRVAHLVLQDAGVPAVQVIQVGDIYFVRDGHHRVSAALASGREFIDAEVTVWDMPHPLPWEQLAGRPGAVRRVLAAN